MPQVRYILYEKVKRKRSTYGIPEREECSAAERHSQDAVWKVASELEYLERCMHCSTDIPGSSPLTDMMSITKVVPRTISPFVQKRFLYRGLFNVMHLSPFAEGKLSWDDVLTNVMHLRCIIDHLLKKGRYHEQRIKQDL